MHQVNGTYKSNAGGPPALLLYLRPKKMHVSEHYSKDFIVRITYCARGAIPLARPKKKPFIMTGTPAFPAAVDATWLIQIIFRQPSFELYKGVRNGKL